MSKHALLRLALVFLALSTQILLPPLRREIRARLNHHTVASRLDGLMPKIEPLWRARFDKAGIAYPPTSITIVGLKQERELRIYVGTSLLASYPFTAASGTLGPKLREGDLQVPEGLYAVESLNPNSRYHLALRVGYPSDEDRRIAAAESRTNLGGDIMIHGSNASVGCIALGDPAIEEVFVLAGIVGHPNIELILAPSLNPVSHITPETAAWVADRYSQMHERLTNLTN